MAAAAASNYGKIAAAAFTWSQWEELERQTLIYKYMMASIPVPPELLFPISKRPPQSNNSAWDMRNGTDPEPWRCRRTDGKKWRCSRDVAPDQKYCERHAHKTRPRSRKHVEAQSHTTTKTTTTTVNNYTQHPLILSTDFASAASYDQSRCTEWFMKGGTSTVPGSTSSQQWQQLMQSSTREGLTRNNLERDKNFCGIQHFYEDIQEPMDLNQNRFSVQRLENHQQLNDHGSLFDTKFCDSAHTTRHFLDDWSMGVKEEHVPPNRKLHISSLSLSMAGGIGIGVENEHAQMGLGMITSDRESSGALKSKWLWDNSPPGGPLGEALCLGIAGSAKGYSNLPSPHGCSNSTTTSSCSKSSCEDDTRARSFIR